MKLFEKDNWNFCGSPLDNFIKGPIIEKEAEEETLFIKRLLPTQENKQITCLRGLVKFHTGGTARERRMR